MRSTEAKFMPRMMGRLSPVKMVWCLTLEPGMSGAALVAGSGEEEPFDAIHALFEALLAFHEGDHASAQGLDAIVEDLELRVEVLRQYVLIGWGHGGALRNSGAAGVLYNNGRVGRNEGGLGPSRSSDV